MQNKPVKKKEASVGLSLVDIKISHIHRNLKFAEKMAYM